MYGVSLAQVNFASELNASTSLCACSIGRSVPAPAMQPPRAGHALEQVAVVLSGLGHHQQLAAVGQTVAAATLTSRSGSMSWMALTTACATPPE